jgi:hypothetical protein
MPERLVILIFRKNRRQVKKSKCVPRGKKHNSSEKPEGDIASWQLIVGIIDNTPTYRDNCEVEKRSICRRADIIKKNNETEKTGASNGDADGE